MANALQLKQLEHERMFTSKATRVSSILKAGDTLAITYINSSNINFLEISFDKQRVTQLGN